MSKLKLVTAKGYSKEEAFQNSGLAADFTKVTFDATTAFKNMTKLDASEPIEAFATEYIEKRIKGLAGVAFSITVEPGIADSRERPYHVTNIVTKGARTWKTVYLGVVGANDKGIGGVTVFSKDTLADAEAAGKAYVTENKQGVVIRVGKEVTGSVSINPETKEKTLGGAQDVAMTIDYTPSINATLGEYIFFGLVD